MPDVNLQYILSVALLDGKLTFEAAHDRERMNDPQILAIKSRVQLRLDPELTHARPRRQGIVEVATRDGRALRKHVVGVRGTAANPMTTQEVEEKARDIVSSIVGKDRCETLISMIENLEAVGDVRELRSCLAS
jgi:2-methylcitrate dehydratase PrpD